MDMMEINASIQRPSKSHLLAQNLNLVTLPNTLWAVHTDPMLNFAAFLHLNPHHQGTIIVDKALVLHFDGMTTSSSIYINGQPVQVPELNFCIGTVSEVTNFLYMFQKLRLCDNSLSSGNSNCRKYTGMGGNCDNLCVYCSSLKFDNLNDYFGKSDENEVAIMKDIMDPPNYKGDTKKVFPCEVCGKNFSSKIQLCEHSRLHTGIKPYECNFCHKTSSHRSTHRKHMLAHTESKPFLCNVCGKRFNTKCRMNDHMLIHNTEKKHQCNVCYKKFSNSNNLKIHYRTHTGDKPYDCKICGKTYTTPSNLAFHIKSLHSEEKPYTCSICDMRFVHPRHLRIHMRRHTGEKPFQCLVCGKSFAKKIHLTVHNRTHTGEKPYNCTTCGKCFTTTGNLSSHAKIHYKDQSRN